MRRDFFPLVAILLLFSALSHGQAWSGILAPSRAIDWTKAGLPATITYGSGGSPCNGTSSPGNNCVETTTNPWTPPTRVQSGSTITCANTSSDATTINNALSAAYPGSYVLIGAGTCDITGNINLVSGVTLRGSGPQSTTLNLSGTLKINFGGCCTGINSGALSATSYAAGTSSVNINNTTCGSSCSFAAGGIAYVEQCDTGWTGSGTASGDSTNVNCSGTYSDNGGLWVCNIDTTCSVDSSSGSLGYYQRQTVTIAGAKNNGGGSYTVTFSPGLYMPNWSGAQTSGRNAMLFWLPMANHGSPATTYPNVGSGLEDLTVNYSFNSNESVVAQGMAPWIKGVRFLGGTAVSQISNGISEHWLLMNNYMYSSTYNHLMTGNTEEILYAQDSDDLFLNNIVQQTQSFWGNGQNSGTVIAYNYERDGANSYFQNLSEVHNGFSVFKLEEGNESGIIEEDPSHGADDLNTDFRNYLSGWDPPYFSQNSLAFELGNYHRFVNVIGNALGGNQSTVGYSGSEFGNVFQIQARDALTSASFMRWGNCDTFTGTCRFQSSEVPNSTNMPSGTYPNATAWQNSTPSDNNLPCSFFISGSAFTTSPCSIKTSGGTGLSWWKVATAWSSFPSSPNASSIPPFPPIGPDQTGGPYVNGTAYDIPAAVAFKNLPIDTALQNSLSVTASQWSNSVSACNLAGAESTSGIAPCEILTVTLSGIDNGSANHIIGGFRLSGVNSACLPSSGISYTGRADGEIVMTSSNTGKIAYSLGSSSPDNGSNNQCTGTMLWPDVRQFDERVYQDDSGGNPPPFAPTGLSAVVQ